MSETEQSDDVLDVVLERPGYDALWCWFSMSYASWLTMPRVLMHEMPDDWQARMAALLTEWDAAWDTSDLPSPSVTAKDGRKFTKWPGWLLNYRRPDMVQINRLRSNATAQATAKTAHDAG